MRPRIYNQIKKQVTLTMKEARNIMKVSVERRTHIKEIHRNNRYSTFDMSSTNFK